MLSYQEILPNLTNNNTFNTTFIPLSNTLMVYVEGVYQDPATYTLNEKTITFIDTDTIPGNYIVVAAYNYETPVPILELQEIKVLQSEYNTIETLVNEGTNIFKTTYTPIKESLLVYVEGVFQDPEKYILDITSKTITFTDTDLIPKHYIVTVSYDKIILSTTINTIPAKAPSSNTVITTKSTIVEGGEILESKYLVVDLNDKAVAIPVFKMKLTSPDIDFMVPYTDLIIEKTILLDNAQPYNDVKLAINFIDSLSPAAPTIHNFAIPLFKVENQEIDGIAVKIKDATVVSETNFIGSYMVVKINNDAWAIPLYTYRRLYPFNNTVDPCDVDVTTNINISPTTYDAKRDAGSTNLNPKIKTYQDVMKRVKMQMGWPVVQIEICDEAIVEHIDTAIEWYTKYAGYTEEILAFDSRNYQCGYGMQIDKMISQLYCMSQCEPCLSTRDAGETQLQKSFYDYDLDSYRKVVDLWSFDEANQGSSDYLFSMEYIFAQQTYFSYVLGNYGFDLVTWHILKDWIDTREKMFALKRRYHFDDRNQILRLYPEPGKNERFIGVVGCYVEKPIKDIIMERWVYQYALALSKITVGNIRGKFTSVTQFGGGTINYNDLLNQGLEEKKQLEDEIMNKHGEVAPIKFFVG